MSDKNEKKVPYMSMKNEELFEMIDKYELDKTDYVDEKGSLNRVKLCKLLKMIDVQVEAATGKLAEAVAIHPDGDVTTDVKKKKLHKKLGGMMVETTFYNVDENDLPYVQMGLNGIALIVPREKKVWIPKEFIDGVLNNCIQHKMKMNVSSTGKISYIPKAVHRFQHTVHDIKHIDVLRNEYDEKKK